MDLMRNLPHGILQTVRYFNLFDQPVTAVQIWRTLIAEPTETPPLREIQEKLAQLVREQRLDVHYGYYFLPSREVLVVTRMRRHLLAQLKWKLTQRIARWLQYVPFVRTLAMSGSLAAGNTKTSSDLDIFVITEKGCIWTARLGLLLLTQLLGRRRKYWEGEAPNKVCLNHYVTTKSLKMPDAIHNVYTAVLYHWLVPLTGLKTFWQYQAANDEWMKQRLVFPESPQLPNRHTLTSSPRGEAVKNFFEQLLSEPIFAWVERAAERMQRWFVARHAGYGGAGRVVLSNNELAFHPDTKVPSILNRFHQDPAQQELL